MTLVDPFSASPHLRIVVHFILLHVFILGTNVSPYCLLKLLWAFILFTLLSVLTRTISLVVLNFGVKAFSLTSSFIACPFSGTNSSMFPTVLLTTPWQVIFPYFGRRVGEFFLLGVHLSEDGWLTRIFEGSLAPRADPHHQCFRYNAECYAAIS